MRVVSPSVVGVTLLLAVGTAAAGRAQMLASEGGSADHHSVLAQPSGLVVHEVPLATALAELGVTSGVVVAFSPSLVSKYGSMVSCDCSKLNLREVLDRTLRATGLTYAEIKGQVVVFLREMPDVQPEVIEQPPSRIGLSDERVMRSLSLPISLLMQGASVAGVVVDRASNQPLSGAQITVVGQPRRAITDSLGRFRIQGVTGQEITLRAVLLGYKPLTLTTRVGASDLSISLEQAAISLEEVVVTAVGPERLREVGGAIARMPTASIVETAPVTNLAEALSGRVSGVVIENPNGTSIGRSEIRIRGASSPSRSNAPLVYIDGVRVDADPASMSSSVQANGQIPSRLNDLNPEEIESIDVIKGPSASTLYGTEAANGVLLITTKSGKSGGQRSEWHVWTEGGLSNDDHDYPANYGAVDASGAPCLLTSVAAGSCSQAGVKSFNLLRDPSTTFFKTGHRGMIGLSSTGSTGAVSHFISGELESNKGVFPNDGVDRVSLRGNFSVLPDPAVEVQVNTGYVSSNLSTFAEGGTVLGPISNGLVGRASPDGWFQFSPQQLAQLEVGQRVERFIGGTTVQVQPARWLQLRGVIGLDATTRQDNELFPPGVLTGARAPGIRATGRNQTLIYTDEFLGRVDLSLTDAISSRSSVGAQYFRSLSKDLLSTGTGLVPGSNSLADAAMTATTEQTAESRTLGIFVDQQFGYRDRRFLSVGLRGDNNTSFGGQLDFIAYPKISGSWVISDEPFFPSGNVLNSLRLRAAWGQSGRAPGPTDALRFFNPYSSTVPSGADSVGVSFDRGNLGNPNLKPERSSEVEVGLDVGFLQDRITLSVGYYNKKTSDALVYRNLGPSVGASPGRWENLASARNRGVEGSADIQVVQRDNLTVGLTTSIAYNQNRLLDLGEGISPIAVSNVQRHVNGYPLGGYWARLMTSFQDANGDGIIDRDELTATDTAVYLGTPIPPFTATVQPVVTLFKRLRIGGLLDIRGGNKLYNFTEGFRCNQGNSRARNDPSTPLEEQARCVAHAAGIVGNYVESANFTKLRELSFSFTIPRSWTRLPETTVTFAGQNLVTWTKYTGIDPEANSAPPGGFATSDFLQPAPVRSWRLRISTRF